MMLKKKNENPYLNLLRTLKIIKPDIIYSRDSRRIGLYALFSKLLRIPLFYGVNYYIEGVPFNFSFLIEKTLRCYKISNKLPSWPFFGYLTNKSLPYVDKIICQNHDQKNFLLKNKLKSIIIFNGHPKPSERVNKTKPLLIVWIANIKRYKKQPDVFIDLARECQDLDAKFILCGRPSSDLDYQAKLENDAQQLGNLIYLGEISNDEVNKLLSEASIIVNTSTAEGLPNTFIQAWLRETPAVTLYADPNNFITEEGIGLYSGNFEKMVENVRYLIKHEDIREEMGILAKRFANENFEIGNIGKKYIEIFQEVIENT